MRSSVQNRNAHRIIGQWLQEKRQEAGFTQTQLATKLGRHRSYVAKYEAGKRVEIVQFVMISRVLKADPREGIRLIMQQR